MFWRYIDIKINSSKSIAYELTYRHGNNWMLVGVVGAHAPHTHSLLPMMVEVGWGGVWGRVGAHAPPPSSPYWWMLHWIDSLAKYN